MLAKSKNKLLAGKINRLKKKETVNAVQTKKVGKQKKSTKNER